jgi:predicted MPP superfamily phosphohydrolase
MMSQYFPILNGFYDCFYFAMNKLTRREFIKFSGLSFATLMVTTSSILMIGNEINEPVVKPLTFPIKGLRPGLEGFKIAQITDIHLEPYTQVSLVEKAVQMTNQLHPDVVVLTGDFVWRWAESAFELGQALSGLNPRLGVYAVMGNHDYWTDIRVVQQGFDEARIPVLYNQGITLSGGKDQLYLAGMDDGWSGKPDLQAAVSNAPENAPIILLLHEPDLADEVAQNSRVNLQLAGHTHGGQVRIPGPIVLPYLGRKYEYGLYQVSPEMWVYTNGGLGTISIPYRYHCPPEITLITLTSG